MLKESHFDWRLPTQPGTHADPPPEPALVEPVEAAEGDALDIGGILGGGGLR